MSIWDTYRADQYISLYPWVWVQLESSEPPGPFPFLGGVDPQIVGSLHQVHSTLLSSVETAISDIMAHRAPLNDPALPKRLEDAYSEVVESRPRLKAHIQCGRQADGTFHWGFQQDPTATAAMSYQGLRIFNAVTRNAIPFGFERPMSSLVGKFLGFLNGSHTVGEIRTIATASGQDAERHLTKIFELLKTHDCLALSDTSSVRDHWLKHTCDQDMIHLGHAALMYRHQDEFFWFDPWLMPWFAESPVPSLWTSMLPRPAAVFLTHDHDDHVDPRTLLQLPKDVPIFVPSRKNRKGLYYDYLSLMRELGFTNVTEMAHGDTWKFQGCQVVSVPFYGEDPCDLALPRNCYLVVDRGHNTLVHADSGPANDGQSALKDGVISDLVRHYGPIATVFASQQQLKEVRSYAAYACLSPPGKWLEAGENGFLTNQYLADICATAQARQFVSYATGGADWYPDHLSFMFSHRNPARTALLTANWDRPESLKASLDPFGCAYHCAQALDIVQAGEGGSVKMSSAANTLTPLQLFQLDHPLPAFLSRNLHS